jgi:hypothetical protein
MFFIVCVGSYPSRLISEVAPVEVVSPSGKTRWRMDGALVWWAL